MGTRGVIVIIFKNRTYCIPNSYDSYPSGLGKALIREILRLLSRMTLEDLKRRFDNVIWYDMGEGEVDIPDSFEAGLEYVILHGVGYTMNLNRIDFEYKYEIDLDQNTLTSDDGELYLWYKVPFEIIGELILR